MYVQFRTYVIGNHEINILTRKLSPSKYLCSQIKQALTMSTTILFQIVINNARKGLKTTEIDILPPKGGRLRKYQIHLTHFLIYLNNTLNNISRFSCQSFVSRQFLRIKYKITFSTARLLHIHRSFQNIIILTFIYSLINGYFNQYYSEKEEIKICLVQTVQRFISVN